MVLWFKLMKIFQVILKRVLDVSTKNIGRYIGRYLSFRFRKQNRNKIFVKISTRQALHEV